MSSVCSRAVLLFAAMTAACAPIASPSAQSPSSIDSHAAVPIATITGAATPPSSATCHPLPTPDYLNQVPPHAPVNGQPTLGVPVLSGVILVQIQQCRDIAAILLKYGLPGPASRYIDVPNTPEYIANGAARWFRVGVTPGSESATVVELYRHPEDIAYVQLIPEFLGGAAGG
jgi:hypothetical protein